MPQAKDLLGLEFGKVNQRCALFAILIFNLAPIIAMASVESSLVGIQTKLTGVILPVLSVIGIAVAGLSFIAGHENAKKHIIYV